MRECVRVCSDRVHLCVRARAWAWNEAYQKHTLVRHERVAGPPSRSPWSLEPPPWRRKPGAGETGRALEQNATSRLVGLRLRPPWPGFLPPWCDAECTRSRTRTNKKTRARTRKQRPTTPREHPPSVLPHTLPPPPAPRPGWSPLLASLLTRRRCAADLPLWRQGEYCLPPPHVEGPFFLVYQGNVLRREPSRVG